MEKEIYKVFYVLQENIFPVDLELTEKEDVVEIKFCSADFMIQKQGDNYFDTLIEIRKDLEKQNIKLLCKGCSKYVYPSAMLLSMGTGEKAYVLTYGKRAKMESLVNIFDSCSVDEYATIQEQLEYYKGWIKSLR